MSLSTDREHTGIRLETELRVNPAIKAAGRRGTLVTAALPLGFMLAAAAAGPTVAAGCTFEPQGEGRVAAVIDARSFRLQDGREVILAGIDRSWPIRKKAAAHRLWRPQGLCFEPDGGRDCGERDKKRHLG
jgi:hypothetical protein